MVRALGDADHAEWLEPSHGDGAFVEAMSRLGIERERIFAIDLDTTTATADSLAITFRGVDFLRWANESERRFDRIVANPPFIAISRLPASLQKCAASVLDPGGQPIGKGANVWCAFVLASLRLLRPGGCVAFVLPSAAEFADYSAAIRGAVAESFGSLELYQCARPLFDKVQDGTLVALGRAYGAGPCAIGRRRFSTRAALIQGLSQSDGVNGHRCPRNVRQTSKEVVSLDSVATIRLGGVTGDVGFFLMNEEKRKYLKLPVRALRPVVSKAKHLRSATLTNEKWQELRSADERVWLFDPPDALLEHPKVKRYLKLDVTEGGCNRQAYKVSIRDPWFCTPMPERPDAFLSGMSQHGPWLCINETQRVNATNTLYVVSFSTRNRNDWYMWALALLSSHAQRQIRRIGRRYPDGLIKFEPGALGAIVLPQLKRTADHENLYGRAIAAICDGRAVVAREIADSLVSGSSKSPFARDRERTNDADGPVRAP
jgi:hypothetical protein